MKHLTLTLLIGMAVLQGCASADLTNPHSLLLDQPSVLQINPPPEAELTNPTSWNLHFSQRIDIRRITEESIVLMQGTLEPTLMSDWSQLEKTLGDEDTAQIPLIFSVAGVEQEIQIKPGQALAPGDYYLIVTPNLFSIQGLPFNQRPGENPTAYLAHYSVGGGSESQTGEESQSEEGVENFGPFPDFLVINEFQYDGLASETDGEAFIELYGTPGADISLFQIQFINGSDGETTEQITLSPHSLIGPEGIFVIADLKTNSTADSKVIHFNFLDQFDPQNGPDSVFLLDREGRLLDTLGYGEGMVSVSKEGYPLWEESSGTDVGPGHSLSRTQGQDTNNNFIDFKDLLTPSPGSL